MTPQIFAFLNIMDEFANLCCIVSSMVMLIGFIVMYESLRRQEEERAWQKLNKEEDETPDDSPYGK